MTSAETYNTIASSSIAEYKDRGSRFIAYAYPISSVDAFKVHASEIKKLHPKATHHCFAYRIGTDGNLFRSNDAGEPSGSAGKPILGQIDSRELTNVVVFVVRYFGGTLLGVPGLIHAYKTAAALALQLCPVVKKNIEKQFVLEFDYNRMSEVMHMLKQYQCTVYEQQLQLFCVLKTGIPIKHLSNMIEKFREISTLHFYEVKTNN